MAHGDTSRLSGSLATLSLVGLVQILSAERRTGRIEVEGTAARGDLWMEGGRLVHVDAADGAARITGEDALDRLLGLDAGRFAFHDGDPSPDRTLAGSTDHLLMEAACRRDHSSRAESEGVPPTAIPSFAPVPEGGTSPRFTTLQWRVLASIDGAKDVAALAAEVGLPEQAMARLVGDLLDLGVVRVR